MSEWCYEPNGKGEYTEGMKLAPNSLQRNGYRLPTSLEWEFACRVGSVTRFSFGETEELAGRYAWHMGNSLGRMRPVGTLRPNDLGLFDMHGNAREWCYGTYKRWEGKPIDDVEDVLVIGKEDKRIWRSGDIADLAINVGSTPERSESSIKHSSPHGFRLARTLP